MASVKAKKRKSSSIDVNSLKDSFDEISPVTGEMCVLVEEIDTEDGGSNIYKMCMQSGYQTYANLWKLDNEDMIHYVEKQMTKYIRDSRVVDSHNSVWYPITSITTKGILHLIRNDKNQALWAITEVTPAPAESLETDETNLFKYVKVPLFVNGQINLALYKMNDKPTHVAEAFDFENIYMIYLDMIQGNTSGDNE